MSTKLLIPAAGRALRMAGIAKELLPLGVRTGKLSGHVLPIPVIAWSLQAGLQTSVQTAIIVTSAEKEGPLIEAIASLDLPLSISYIQQSRPDGLADAIMAAESYIMAEDVVLLLLADGVMWPLDVLKPLIDDLPERFVGGVALHQVDQPSRFGIGVFDEQGSLREFEEKPALPRSNWAWTAIAFRKPFFGYLERGGLQPGDPVRNAMNSAVKDGVLQVTRCKGRYWDVGTYESYISAIQTLGLVNPSNAQASSKSPYVRRTQNKLNLGPCESARCQLA